MKKGKAKKKEWEKRRREKNIRRLQRKNKGHYTDLDTKKPKIKALDHEYRLTAPKIFSIVDNSEETLMFFSSVFDIIGDR